MELIYIGYFCIWFVLGVIGSSVFLYFGWYLRGLTIDHNDINLALFMCLFGPIALAPALIYMIVYFLKKLKFQTPWHNIEILPKDRK